MARPKRIDQITEYRDDICEERIVHVDAVLNARGQLPGFTQVGRVSTLLSLMADPTRARIIAALRPGELCVCDLAAVVGQSESAISHQLRVLRENNLVHSRKEGRRKYYGLADDHVAEIFGMALAHVDHEGWSS